MSRYGFEIGASPTQQAAKPRDTLHFIHFGALLRVHGELLDARSGAGLPFPSLLPRPSHDKEERRDERSR